MTRGVIGRLPGGHAQPPASLGFLVTTTDEQQPTSRVPLPEGTIPVGIGLLVAGLASFAFLKVGTNALGGDHEFGPVQALWFTTFALAPGFFLPLEQELSRALSHRRALGQGGKPVLRKVAQLGVVLAVTVAVVVLAGSAFVTDEVFDGHWALTFALIVAFVSYAPVHLARGIASGSARFRAYGIIMGADGAMRVAFCMLLAAFGVKAAGPYGFAVALAPLTGLLWVATKGELGTDDGPPASWKEVTPNLGWLLVGSVFAAGLVNAGPIAANLLKDEGQTEMVTQFGKGVLLSRIPLFLFQAVQAALLPRLARLAARNEIAEFRNGFRKLLLIVVGVGVVGTAGAFALGPFVMDKMYKADLSGRTMAMLAVGSAIYMLALALAQAVIALKGHALVGLGWGIGMATFVVVTWLSSDDLFRRIEFGLVASSAASLVTFAIALQQRLRAGVVPSGHSAIDAINDMPLEA